MKNDISPPVVITFRHHFKKAYFIFDFALYLFYFAAMYNTAKKKKNQNDNYNFYSKKCKKMSRFNTYNVLYNMWVPLP